jgi:hypothetical protein
MVLFQVLMVLVTMLLLVFTVYRVADTLAGVKRKLKEKILLAYFSCTLLVYVYLFASNVIKLAAN